MITKNYTEIPYILLGNEGDLHQVFFNILTNAIQSILEKGTISISTNVSEKKLLIQILDTGYGIKKENIKKIIDPFFTTKEPGEGVGLGMSIAYSIVKKHNGNIKYKSKIGKGTTVTLTFPIKK